MTEFAGISPNYQIIITPSIGEGGQFYLCSKGKIEEKKKKMMS